MTPKTPREALEAIKSDTRLPYSVREDMCIPTIQTAILTALAQFLRTPGTVEVCTQCHSTKNASGDNSFSRGSGGDNYCLGWDNCIFSMCPIKQVTNEKA